MLIENESGKISTINKRNRIREFLEGDSKYLVLMLIVAIAVISYLILQRADLISQKISSLFGRVGPTPIILPTTAPEKLKNPWVKTESSNTRPSVEESFNYLEFVNHAVQIPSGSPQLTLSSRFAAEVMQIILPDSNTSNLSIKVKSRLSANKGKVAWFVFPPSHQKILKVTDGPGNNLSASDLKPNDVIVIDQTLMPLQDYETGIKAIKITRL